MNTKSLENVKLYVAIFIIALLTNGCIEDNFELKKLSTHVENEGLWKIPGLINTSFKIGDIIKQMDTTGTVTSEDDGLILIVYSDTLQSSVAQDVVKFPDQVYDTLFDKQDFNAVGGFSNGTVTMQKNEINFLFAVVGSELLDSILFNSATMNVKISSSFKYEGSVILTFPKFRKNGIPYKKEIKITDNSGAFTFDKTYNDLEGYVLDFSDFSDVNNFFVSYKLNLIEETGDGTISDSDNCDIVINFTDLKYDYVWGHIGKQTLHINERRKELDFFNSFAAGDIELRNPRIIVRVNNSFGMEASLFMNQLKLRVIKNREWIDLVGQDIPDEDNPWTVLKPIDNYPNDPLFTNQTFTITGLGSNLGEIVSRLPEVFKYEETIVLNMMDTISRFDFLDADSKFEAIIDFEIPLWGRSSRIDYCDTLSMDLSEVAEKIDLIDYLDLFIKIGNGLPNDVLMKAYLMDSKYRIVDSLPNGNDTFEPEGDMWWAVKSGIMGADSLVNQKTGKTLTEHVIRIEGDGVDVIEDVKYLKVDLRYNTTDGTSTKPPFVKYFDFYEMDVNVALEVKLNINENL